MKFNKIHLDDIKRCYCASHMEIDGNLVALFASEDPKSICNMYFGEHFDQKETVWNDAENLCARLTLFVELRSDKKIS